MHQNTLANKNILTNLIKCSQYGHCAFVDSLHNQKCSMFILCDKNTHLIVGFQISSTRGNLFLALVIYSPAC